MNQWFTRLSATAIVCSISVPSAASILSHDRNLSVEFQAVPNFQLAQASPPEFELKDFDFWANQCRSLAELQDYENEIKACEQAIALKPKQDNVDLWMARSDALFQLKQYTEALVSYNYVLSIAPNSSFALTQKCAALYQLGRYETAIDTCESALRINGNWGTSTPALAWYNRGLALQMMGKTTESLESYNRAQQINPDEPLVEAERCRLLPSLRQDATVTQNCGLQDAVTAYEHALAGNPNDAIAWINQGLSLEQIGEPTRALTAYKNAVQINPKSSFALAHQCAMLNQVKQYQEALTACEQALQGDGIWQGGSPAYVWNQQSRALIGLEKYEEAISAAERAIALNPNNAEAWNSKAVGLWKLAEYDEAKAAIERATQIDPLFADAWFNQGRILSSLPSPNYQKVASAYCQALSTNQYNCLIYRKGDLIATTVSSNSLIHADILTNLSAALYQLEDYRAAAEAAQDATVLNPASFEAWYNRGLALVDLGDTWKAPDIYRQAEDVYDHANLLSPNNIYVLTGKGRALAGQGKTQEAIAAFETALNISPSFTPAQEGLKKLLQSAKNVNAR